MSSHGEAMISLVALQIHRDTPSGDDPFWHDQHQVRQSLEGRNGKDFKPGSCQEELLSPELTVETPTSPAIRSAASVAYTKGKQVKTKKTWHISALNDWRFSHGQHPQWWDRVLQTSASPGNTWLIQKRADGPMDRWTSSLHLWVSIWLSHECLDVADGPQPQVLLRRIARTEAVTQRQPGLVWWLGHVNHMIWYMFLGVRNTWVSQCLKEKTPVLSITKVAKASTAH